VTLAELTPEMVEGRAQVMHRALGVCEVRVTEDCRRREPEWHHRQSRRTGRHGPENGLAACRSCHGWVHAHPEEATRNGWIVPTWAEPEDVRALIVGVYRTLTRGGTYA
jgi:hypothetical protein